MKISVLIPVYNSGEILLDTYKNIKQALEKNKNDYEILFRNDGSTDNSKKILKRIVKNDKKVKFFSNTNHGLGFVLRHLFKDATGDILIYMDADAYLSFDLNMLPRMLKETQDFDAVIASRYKNGIIPIHRLIPSRIYKIINMLLFGINVDDVGSGFVVFREDAINSLELNSDGFDIHIEIFTKLRRAGFKILEIPVRYSHWQDGSFSVFSHGPRTLMNTIKFRLRE